MFLKKNNFMKNILLTIILYISFRAICCSENTHIRLQIENDSQSKAIKLLEKYQEPRIDFYSYFDKTPPTALALMKEKRYQRKKSQSLYSFDRVLFIKNENDIIYEYYEPALGPFPPFYEICRIIKLRDTYLNLSYVSEEGKPAKETIDKALKTLLSVQR